MSASLAMSAACTPVSSLTSRRAVCGGFSPLSIAPLGRATRSVGDLRLGFVLLADFFGRSMWGSMTARNRRPRIFRNTTPPAENSRTMGAFSGTGLVWQSAGKVAMREKEQPQISRMNSDLEKRKAVMLSEHGLLLAVRVETPLSGRNSLVGIGVLRLGRPKPGRPRSG